MARNHLKDAERLREIAEADHKDMYILENYKDQQIFDYWMYPDHKWNTTKEWFTSKTQCTPQEYETEYILAISLAAILAKENNL